MHQDTCFVGRRQFLCGAAATLANAILQARESEPLKGPWDGPAVVRKIYLGSVRAGWPRPDVDQAQDVKEIEAGLADVEKRYPGRIRFTGGELVRNIDELTKLLAQPSDADAILVFPMVTIVKPMIEKVLETGKPVIQFSLPYAGHDWTHAAAWMQKGRRLELIAAGDFHELDPYVPLLGTIHHLRASKVLLVSPQASRPNTEKYTRQFGTVFEFPAYLDLKAVYDKTDVRKAEKIADEFIRAAARMVEPTRGEVVDSIRLWLALDTVLRERKANAIAIDCLGGFGRKELPAYPCIAFTKLNDIGLYGVCENDLPSTMTQMLVTSFSGRPGFVSDPVFDTSRNEVIHAHCVSATRLRGLEGEASPYIIRSHLEDHKGVSLQVLAPANEPVTVARFVDADLMMVSRGEAVGNVDNERGCRTKIRTKVKDSRRLLAQWADTQTKGPGMPGTRDLLHRVVFYGDHLNGIETLGRLTGFKVVQEDRVEPAGLTD